MPQLNYEHHLAIRQDKLCPFKCVFVPEAFECPCNWHKNIELIRITQGNGVIQYGSRELPFCEGDLIIVNTGALHRLYSPTGISYYYLIIDEDFCVENGINTQSRVFTEIFRSDETTGFYEAAVREIERYNRDKGDRIHMKASKARLAVLALLIDVCENHSKRSAYCEKEDTPSEEYVKRVISHVSDHYRETLTLDGLAQLCGITKCHLAREFKRYTGQTVLVYLNTLRCKNAERCLAEGMSVTETAYVCGFGSISYFSRTYKKIMGVMPSASLKR